MECLLEKILDKIIILVCCSIFLFYKSLDIYTVVPFIIIIIFASINIAFDYPFIHIGSYILYLVLCYFFPDLTHFIPLLCYDLFFEPYKYVSAAAIFVFYNYIDDLQVFAFLWLFALLLLTYLLKLRTSSLLTTRIDSYLIRDGLIEQSQKLKNRNKELLEKQDYEVTNATLNERNRIAREIHDTVGHLLSSSILQIGALLAITKDEATQEYLTQIKDTLSTGMDSIRTSIHNIHEDSMDLEAKLNDLIKNFTYCTVSFKYKITTDFSMKEKYSIIFIIRESLANVMKHSNASNVNIILAELPGFYQIIIEDNGTNINSNSLNYRGMGISSIYERINGLGGTLNITTNNGYKLFIVLPKN